VIWITPIPFASADLGNVTVSTFPSVTTSTDYLGALFVECRWTVVLRDPQSYGSVSLRAFWNAWNECSLPTAGPVSAASLSQEDYYDPYVLTDLPDSIPARAKLLECSNQHLQGKDDPAYLFNALAVWPSDLAATNKQGSDAPAPRVCLTDIVCDGGDTGDEPYGFEWDPLPDCGDASGDGQLASSDALGILRVAVGIDDCSPVPEVCDTDDSGTSTSSDALVLLRKVVGIAVELRCPIACTD